MSDLPLLKMPVPLTPAQFAKVRKMTRTCANMGAGRSCLKLDDGDPYTCPQYDDNCLECRYFGSYILPEDIGLLTELLEPGAVVASSTRICAMCGGTFKAASSAAKYCPSCRLKATRLKARERKRRQRG